MIAALVSSIVLATTAALLRRPITQFFLVDHAEPDVIAMGENLLLLNAFSLIPDSIRIMTSLALNAWDEILKPSSINFLYMTLWEFRLEAWLVA